LSYNNVPPPYRPVGGQMPPTVYSGPSPRTWANAPKIVRGWAYPLSWLGIVFWGILLVSSLMMAEEMLIKVMAAAACAAFFSVTIWLNRGLKTGAQAAWILQIVFSTLWLVAFPLWTIVNGYILTSWFKPETKAWFEMR
jgi:hypothetical protein